MANFLFILSKDENEPATRCFQLAKIAHSKDITSICFLSTGCHVGELNEDLHVKTITGIVQTII